MRYLPVLVLLLTLLVTPAAVYSQEIKSEVGMGITMKEYTEIETQLEQGMPLILEKIKGTGELVKKGQYEEGRAFLKKAIEEARAEEKIFSKESHYKEISEYVDKMEDALTRADQAMEKRQKQAAMTQLKRAYNMTKVIAKSPVLKMVAAEIALGQASRMIGQRNYSSAGIFLQRAIDNITTVQQDPKLNTDDLKKLKNDIIITQNQVVLGQMKDEKRLKSFYPGLAAARANTLNTYYSIWDRNNEPWMMY